MIPMTPMQQRRTAVVGLMYYPSLTVQIFLRKKTGFRHLKHSRIVGLTVLLLFIAYVAGKLPANLNPFSSHTPPAATTAAPQSSAPPPDYYRTAPDGLDSPLPRNWERMDAIAKAIWVQKHQLTPQQLQARHAREAKEAETRQQKQEAETRRVQEAAARHESIRAFFFKLPLTLFAVVFFGWGMVQHHWRWHDLLTGVRWHTRSRGMSFLMPLLGGVMREPNILRFADPLLGFVIGIGLYALLSHALGLWICFAAVAFYIVENHVYEQALERDLDQLDNIVESEIVEEGVKHFKGGPQTAGPSMEETAGVPTGIAPELEYQIARRKERRARERAKKYPPPSPELVQEMREHRTSANEAEQSMPVSTGNDIAPPALALSDIAPPSPDERL